MVMTSLWDEMLADYAYSAEQVGSGRLPLNAMSAENCLTGATRTKSLVLYPFTYEQVNPDY